MAKRETELILISQTELDRPDIAIDPQELINKGLNLLDKELTKLKNWARQNPHLPMMKDDVNALSAYIGAAVRAAKEYRDAMKDGMGDDLSQLTDEDVDKLFDKISKLRAERKNRLKNEQATSNIAKSITGSADADAREEAGTDDEE